jgi:TonB-linked SusC/RagA family outer membrane protein
MRKLRYLLILLLTGNICFAQQREISGTVTNKSDGIPLIGVTVESGKNATTTDNNGKFTINVASGSVIKFSFSGKKTYSYNVTNSNENITVAMENDLQNLDEVVVVGYTSEKKKDLKGAVTVVKMSDALKESNANLFTSLQGRVPGLDVSTDGAPGGGTFVNLRGLASINNNTPPLLIIDGVPTYDFNGLSPNDIESLQVLKDAASAAIYGARASSGVIVITTKKGKSKKAKVTFDGYYGSKTRRGKIDMLDALQYGQTYWTAYENDNGGATPNDITYGNGPQPVIPAYIDPPNNTTPSGNTDWQKETFQPATNMAYNLGISQASERSNFYFGVNYNREDGLAKTTYYERLNFRLNSSYAITKGIILGENLSIGYLNGNRENEGRVLESGVNQLSIIPLKDNLGNWAGPFNNLGDYLNPVGELNIYKNNISKGWRTFGNVFADVQIIKGLTFHSSFGIDLLSSEYHAFYPTYVIGRFTNTLNSLSENDNHGTNLTASNTLTYHFDVGKHDIQVLAGYEWIRNEAHNVSASSSGFISQSSDYTYLGAGSTITGAGGGGFEYGLVGQFGKINYSYNDKYLFSASLRRDGSSRFGADHRYGVFPAFSAAWRVSDEKFFGERGVAKTVSDFKIRASWGQNGNDNIKNYNYATFYAPSINFANYDILNTNTSSQTGYIVSSIGNPATQWEASQQTNIGIDLGLFNNTIYFTADYYVKKSDKLLYQPQLPAVIGEGTPPFINVGNIRNTGFEFLLSYKGNTKGKLKYNADLSFSTNKNEVLSVGADGNDIIYTSRGIIQKGQPLGEFYGYKYLGILKTQAEVDAYNDNIGKGGIGSMQFGDVNGDKAVDANDRTYLGNPNPKFQMGLNLNVSYGNFDATLFFDSKVGNKIYDEWKNSTDFQLYVSNHGTALLNAWSPSNPDSDIPALTFIDHGQRRTSSYFISDASFVRLKSATIGYNLPESILKKGVISRLRIYFQSENLFTLTKFKGYDYETLFTGVGSLGDLSITQYPHTKGYTFGVNVGF